MVQPSRIFLKTIHLPRENFLQPYARCDSKLWVRAADGAERLAVVEAVFDAHGALDAGFAWFLLRPVMQGSGVQIFARKHQRTAQHFGLWMRVYFPANPFMLFGPDMSLRSSEGWRMHANGHTNRQKETLYGFGSFGIDPRQRMLLREGEPVALPPKAFDTLLVLVQRSGAVVSKDELLEAVWPGQFVEENNLTQYISLLRKTLGDERQKPRFIQTIAKRGYRFCCSVEPAESAAEVQTVAVRAPEVAAVGRAAWPGRWWIAAGVLCVCVGAGASLGWSWHRARLIPLSTAESPVTLAILPYEMTGQPVPDGFEGMALADDMIRQLSGRSAQVRVRTLSAVYRYADGPVKPMEAARELGVTYALAARVEQRGKSLVVDARLVRASDGAKLWEKEFRGADLWTMQATVADAVETSFTGAKGIAPGRPEAGTRILPAYGNFVRGRMLLDERTSEGIYKATDALEAAVADDPTYAPAYAELAVALCLRWRALAQGRSRCAHRAASGCIAGRGARRAGVGADVVGGGRRQRDRRVEGGHPAEPRRRNGAPVVRGRAGDAGTYARSAGGDAARGGARSGLGSGE
jgi:DNA-binding winged helix-turn-helix (wHTH) protein/TolB-like protein